MPANSSKSGGQIFKTSPADGRELYQELAAHSSTVGAYTFVDDDSAQRLNFHDRQTLIAGDCIVDDGSAGSDEERGRLLIHVPSPWHAVIHLLVENRNWLSGRYGGKRQGLIYRGQRDSRWPIVPTIYRLGTDSAFATKAVAAFVELVKKLHQLEYKYTGFCFATPSLSSFAISEFGEEESPVDSSIHVASAQHFGMATPLLDFTTDPAVAVWFACQNSSPGGEMPASVFAIPSQIADALRATILIPHPYVRRVYRQRGLFVNFTPRGPDLLDHGRELRNASVELRFPPDPNFKIIRDAHALRPFKDERELVLFGPEPEWSPDVELLPTDRWWVKSVAAAKKIAEDNRLEALREARALELYDFIGDLALPQEFMQSGNKMFQIRESALDLIQMLLSLTTMMLGPTPRVSETAMRSCVNGSPHTLRAMIPFMSDAVSSLPSHLPLRVATKHMITVLKAALDEAKVPTF